MLQMSDKDILDIQGLKKFFPVEKGFFRRVQGYVRAVDDISFSVQKGQTMGVVGESGCGKTTTARTIIRALEPTDGKIYFRKSNDEIVDMSRLDRRELKAVRSDMQMIFQDPFSSLNPRLSVLNIIAEPLITHGWKREKYKERVRELLDLVELDANCMSRYAHAFSGGQRQRIGIARAISLNPSMVIADEPVSALDVSVQAQILNLLDELQERLGLTYLFIAHDLSVIRYICKKVAVMYLGKIVELADTESLYNNPGHPYTCALLSAVPDADPHQKWLGQTLSGEVPDPSEERKGCPFAARCKYALSICEEQLPLMKQINHDDNIYHKVACHRADELELEGVV